MGVAGAFGKDPRVLGWDIWNEPDNTNDSSYGKQEPPNKVELVLALLPQVFAWVREAGVEQPLTSGVWRGDWSADAKLTPMERIQLEQSDVISFHNYDDGPTFEKRITSLRRYQRPILCTEYMARGNGSTFQGSLPIAKKYNVAAYQLGLRRGQDADPPAVGLVAEALRRTGARGLVPRDLPQDGTPYRQDEVELIRTLTRSSALPAAVGAP